MSAERFRKLGDYFEKARSAGGAERAALLAKARAEDPGLGSELEALLAKDADAASLPGENWVAAPLPERVGPYRIVRAIGAGGMGTVYEAVQEQPRRRVALKLMRSALLSGDAVARFQHEVHALGQLRHPGIAQIYDAGTEGSVPYFTMEYVEGEPLRRNDARSRREQLRMFTKICDAVHHAHLNGVVHRDLKPANILITPDGEPKVLDFGVARITDADATMLTGTGQLVGTIPYMSPEQASGDSSRLDLRTDIYSLGVLLYELLGGRLPYDVRGRPLFDAIRIIHETDPAPLDAGCRGDLETIVRKALRKDRDERYESAAALARDLHRFLRHEPIDARPASAVYLLRKFARRHRALVAGACIAVMALVAATIISIDRARVADRQRRASEVNAYQSAIYGASSALTLHDAAASRRLLDSAPARLRHWEWHYLDSRLDQSLTIHDLGSTVVGASWSDGEWIAITAKGEVYRAGAVIRLDVPGLRSARVSADASRILALTTAPARAVLFDARNGRRIRDFPPRSVYAVSPDGRSVANLGASKLSIAREHADGSWTEWTTPYAGHIVNILRFSPDGGRVVVGSQHAGDGHVGVYDATARGWIKRNSGRGPPVSADWVADRILVSDQERALTLWSADGEELRRVGAPTSPALAIREDAMRAALAVDRSVQLFELPGLASRGALHGHTARIAHIGFSDARIVTAAGAQVRIWDPERTRVAVAAHDSYVYEVEVSPDGYRALSAGWDGCVRIWSMADQSCIGTIRVGGGGVSGAAFSDDGRSITTVTIQSRIEVWDAGTGERRTGWDNSGQAQPTLATVGAWTATTGFSGALWRDGKKIHSWRGARLARGAFSEDGAQYAYITRGGATHVRTLSSGHETIYPGSDARIVRFSPDSSVLAVGHTDGRILLRDLETGQVRHTLEGHRGRVYDLAFSPDGARLATGAIDATVIVWDVANGAELLRIGGPALYVHAVAFSPDGRTLVTGSGDRSIRFHSTRPLHVRAAEALRWKDLRSRFAGPHAPTPRTPDEKEAAAQVRLSQSAPPDR